MKKRIISILVTVAFTVLLVPGSVAGAGVSQRRFTGEDGVEWGYQLNYDGEAVRVMPTMIPENVVDIVVPYELGGSPVVDMVSSTFAGNETIQSVVLPGELRYVGRDAFKDCTILESVTLSEQLTSLGDYSFDGCTSLKSIEIPSSVYLIGEGTFIDCTSLSDVKISGNMESIGPSSFQNNTSLETINIPDNIRVINRNAFYQCTDLKSVTFTEDSYLREIESGAFDGCVSLNDINLPSKLEVIGSNAFKENDSLLSVVIPESVTSIGDRAFDRMGVEELATVFLYEGSYADSYPWEDKFNIKYISEEVLEDNLILANVFANATVGYVNVEIDFYSVVSGGYGIVQEKLEVSLLDGEAEVVKGFYDPIKSHYSWTPTKSGEYTITSTIRDKNGSRSSKSIKYIVNPLSVRKPTADLVSPQAENTAIKLNTEAHGGTGNYTYSYKIKSTLSETEVSGNQSYSWNPKTSGTYLITATVSEWDFIDGVRTRISSVTSEPLEFTIVNPLSVSNITSDLVSPQMENTAIKFNAVASGGSGRYNYRYHIVSNSVDSVVSTTNVDFIWRTKVPGDYTLTVTAIDLATKDSVTGKYNSVTSDPLEFTIVNPLSLPGPSIDPASMQIVGTPVKITIAPLGGYGRLMTHIVAIKGDEVTLVRDYSEESIATWIPSEVGSYSILLTTKDEMGNVATQYINYEIFPTSLAITSVKPNLVSPQSEGTKVTFTATSSRGLTKVLYKFEITNGVLHEITQDFSEKSTVDWTPSKEGKYTIKTTAKDVKGNVSSKTIYFEIVKEGEAFPSFTSMGSKLPIHITEIQNLVETDGATKFDIKFLNSEPSITDCKITLQSAVDVLASMDKYLLNDLYFTLDRDKVSNEILLSKIDPEHLLYKYRLGSNFAKSETDMDLSYLVAPEYEGKKLFTYKVNSDNSFTLVDNEKVVKSYVNYTTQTLGDYVILDAAIEDSLITDLPPVVVPPEVTVPKTADGNNLLVIAFLIIISSTLLIATSKKEKKIKVKAKN